MGKVFYPKELDLRVDRITGLEAPRVPDSYGLEIEAEGVPAGGLDWLRVLPGVWATHVDNSLRDGIEFVSNGPRAFEDLPADIEALNGACKTLGFVPVFGFRTSLHVHMNASDLTVRQLMNLFTLYTIFEVPLVMMGGEERRGNVHCLTVHDTAGVIESLRDFLLGRTAFSQLLSRERRYAAFNWASLQAHNTIEFRSHRGTSDVKTIMAWVTVLHHLRAACQTYDNPQSIVQDFSAKGLTAFTEGIFPNSPDVWAIVQQYQQEVWEGVRIAQEVAYARQEWSKPKAPKESKDTMEVTLDGNAWLQGRMEQMALQRAAVRRGQQPNPADLRWNIAPPIQEAQPPAVPQDDWEERRREQVMLDHGPFDEDGFNEEGNHLEDFM